MKARLSAKLFRRKLVLFAYFARFLLEDALSRLDKLGQTFVIRLVIRL